jgi:hypothetical protein
MAQGTTPTPSRSMVTRQREIRGERFSSIRNLTQAVSERVGKVVMPEFAAGCGGQPASHESEHGPRHP